MSRVTLGIILEGYPECIQKTKAWLKVLEFLAKYIFIPFTIAAVITLGVSLFNNDGDLFKFAAILIIISVVMYVCRILWSEQVRCPYCKHFLTMKQIGNDKTINSYDRNVSRRVHDSSSGMVYDWNGNTAFYTANRSHKEHGVETTKTYVSKMWCRRCGCVQKIKRISVSTRY